MSQPKNRVSRRKFTKRQARIRIQDNPHSYESLEQRNLLATFYPAYVDGAFTLGNSDPMVENPYPLDFGRIESQPGASKTIYLDFNGHASVNNLWNHAIFFDPYDTDGETMMPILSDSEITDMQLIWQAVAEDFAPFDVNVVTARMANQEPNANLLRKNGIADLQFGVRVVVSQSVPPFNGTPGAALFGSFTADTDTPVFVFNKGNDDVAMTISHEVGRSLGLSSDGLGNLVDHPGDGGAGGVTSWGPIMGRPLGSNLTQWSNGDYANATNHEDDYSIITSASNDLKFRRDDYGDTIQTATDLDMLNNRIFQWGFIEDRNDKDVFRFETGFGNVVISVNPFGGAENLDIQATLYNDLGQVVGIKNPLDQTWANFVMTLDAGVYYIEVDGVGLPGSYSDYGSVGFYSIGAELVELTGDQIGESGILTNLDHNWQTVQLDHDYIDPVIVFGPMTRHGNNPATIRLRNVTTTSFDVRIEEYEYLDGIHVDETAGYVVMEAGIYELTDGTLITAGYESALDHNWKSIDLSENGFDEVPIVLAQVVTTHAFDPVVVRIRNANENGFQMRLQEDEYNELVTGDSTGRLRIPGHAPERVGYIAIEPDTGLIGPGAVFQSATTGVVVTDDDFTINFGVGFSVPPVLLAAMQTFNGGDTALVRLVDDVTTTDATFFIEEEQSFDSETIHVAENVGFFAIAPGRLFADEGGPNGGFDFPPEHDGGGGGSQSSNLINVIRPNFSISITDNQPRPLTSMVDQLAATLELGQLAGTDSSQAPSIDSFLQYDFDSVFSNLNDGTEIHFDLPGLSENESE